MLGALCFPGASMLILNYRTLIESLSGAPPHQTFVTMWLGDEEIESVTFQQFVAWAEAQALRFQARGLRCGDRVVLVMPQGIPLMTAFVGAMLLGAVPAILAYPNFKVEPAKYRTGLSGVSANLSARLVVIDDAFPDELLSCIAIPEGSELVRGLGSYTAGAPNHLDPVDLSPEDLAFIQHSAGTTGLQKGVALSHAAVLRQLSYLTASLQLTEQDRVYSWLPLYHDMGLVACFVLPLVCHLPVVMQSPTDWVLQPATMLRLISDYRCTAAWLPNFAFQFLARRVPAERQTGVDLSSLRLLINCSEPVRAESMDEFAQAYTPHGLRQEALQSSYAMAENVFAVTQSGIDRPTPPRLWVDGRRFRQEHRAVEVDAEAPGAVCLVSSGSCLPANEVRITGASGETLREGDVGEILIRSDCLFDGYFNRPDLSAQAIRDGWYYSGDLGFLWGRELYVAGRKKDLIIVAGQNIYPQDVENIACSHPAIHDGRAIALGVYNPDLGTEEIVVVAEVEKEGHLADAPAIELEIRNQIVAQLGVGVRAIHLRPPHWIVKSTAGKPARSATREKLLKECPELFREALAFDLPNSR